MNFRLPVLLLALAFATALPALWAQDEEGPVRFDTPADADAEADLPADEPADEEEYRIEDDYYVPTWIDDALQRVHVHEDGEVESEDLPVMEEAAVEAPHKFHCLKCLENWQMSGGDWYLTGEAVFFTRSNGEHVILGTSTSFETDPAGVNNDALSTQDRENTWSAGPRVTLGYRYGDTDWEISYLGLQHWHTDRTIFGDPVAGLVLITSPFLTIDDAAVGLDTALGYNYSSEYHNAEAIVRREWDHGLWRVRVLGGLRYACLDENFELTGVNGFPTPAQETLTVDTRNDLIGGQLGGGLHWSRGRGLTLDLLTKAGLFANFAQQDIERRVRAFGLETVNLAGGDSDVGVACGLDAGLTVRYAVTQRMTLRMGYEFMLLSGLALAPEQLETNLVSNPRVSGLPPATPNGLNDNGTAVFHGPSVGVEFFWGGR